MFFCFTLQMVAVPGLDQAQAKSLEFHSGLPHSYRGSRAWAIFGCFLRPVSKELDWKSRPLFIGDAGVTGSGLSSYAAIPALFVSLL